MVLIAALLTLLYFIKLVEAPCDLAKKGAI